METVKVFNSSLSFVLMTVMSEIYKYYSFLQVLGLAGI